MNSTVYPETGAEPFASDVSQHVRAPVEKDADGELENELRDQDVPEFGLDQWLLHFMEDVLQSELPDAKLLNFFCLARDKALSDSPAFVDLLERTEGLIFSRMPGGANDDEVDNTLSGYEPDQCSDALQDVCGRKMSDRNLVEIFDLAATLRGDPESGQMWRAVMYLSHAQILRRMGHARDRNLTANADAPNDGEKCTAQCAKP